MITYLHISCDVRNEKEREKEKIGVSWYFSVKVTAWQRPKATVSLATSMLPVAVLVFL